MEARAEVGVDISDNKPKKLTKELMLESDLAVTMGCGEEACPIIPNELRDWDIEDPHGKDIVRVRRIRGEIRSSVEALIIELDEMNFR